MRVHAKRAGWDERLSPEQELDLDPYDREDDDLVGELVEWDVPAGPGSPPAHGPIRVCLVGGQEADPDTVRPAAPFSPGGGG